MYSTLEGLSVFSLHGSIKAAQDGRRMTILDMGTNNATTSRGFCVLTHCNVNLLQVAQGVSPSHLILRRRQRSQAFETDFLRGCQSFTAVGEKRLGPSPAGRVAISLSATVLRQQLQKLTEGTHGDGSWVLVVKDSAPDGDASECGNAHNRYRTRRYQETGAQDGRGGRKARFVFVLQPVCHCSDRPAGVTNRLELP
jgi:hypothetical protein